MLVQQQAKKAAVETGQDARAKTLAVAEATMAAAQEKASNASARAKQAEEEAKAAEESAEKEKADAWSTARILPLTRNRSRKPK